MGFSFYCRRKGVAYFLIYDECVAIRGVTGQMRFGHKDYAFPGLAAS